MLLSTAATAPSCSELAVRSALPASLHNRADLRCAAACTYPQERARVREARGALDGKKSAEDLDATQLGRTHGKMCSRPTRTVAASSSSRAPHDAASSAGCASSSSSIHHPGPSGDASACVCMAPSSAASAATCGVRGCREYFSMMRCHPASACSNVETTVGPRLQSAPGDRRMWRAGVVEAQEVRACMANGCIVDTTNAISKELPHRARTRRVVVALAGAKQELALTLQRLGDSRRICTRTIWCQRWR